MNGSGTFRNALKWGFGHSLSFRGFDHGFIRFSGSILITGRQYQRIAAQGHEHVVGRINRHAHMRIGGEGGATVPFVYLKPTGNIASATLST